MDQDSAVPTNKVTAAALGGALTTLILWAVTSFTAIEPSAEAGGALATLVAFGLAYLVPERA